MNNDNNNNILYGIVAMSYRRGTDADSSLLSAMSLVTSLSTTEASCFSRRNVVGNTACCILLLANFKLTIVNLMCDLQFYCFRTCTSTYFKIICRNQHFFLFRKPNFRVKLKYFASNFSYNYFENIATFRASDFVYDVVLIF